MGRKISSTRPTASFIISLTKKILVVKYARCCSDRICLFRLSQLLYSTADLRYYSWLRCFMGTHVVAILETGPSRDWWAYRRIVPHTFDETFQRTCLLLSRLSSSPKIRKFYSNPPNCYVGFRSDFEGISIVSLRLIMPRLGQSHLRGLTFMTAASEGICKFVDYQLPWWWGKRSTQTRVRPFSPSIRKTEIRTVGSWFRMGYRFRDKLAVDIHRSSLNL